MIRAPHLLALSVLLAALPACDGGRTIEKVDETSGQYLRLLRGDKSELLDPHATNSGGDADLLRQMYEGLLRPSRDYPVTWEPCLATEYSHEGHKVWTFKLREGVVFHDGAAFDSAAVKKSFERIIVEDHPAKPIKRPYAAEFYSGIVDIATPDAMTVADPHRFATGPDASGREREGVDPGERRVRWTGGALVSPPLQRVDEESCVANSVRRRPPDAGRTPSVTPEEPPAT